VLIDSPSDEKTPELMQTASKVLQSKLSYEWMYWSFIKFYIKVPVELNTVHILIGFYYASAYEIRRKPQQTVQLMKLIFMKMIPQLEKYGVTIKEGTERNDFVDNKLVFLKPKLKKFYDNDRNGMKILTPVEEALSEQITINEDEKSG